MELVTMTKPTAWAELERGCDLEEQAKFESAFKFYLKAAKHGNKEAQVNLANLYDDGRGCRRNLAKAVYWYKRAVKAGCSEAAYNLGIHYRQHGKQRCATYWLKRAATMGV